MKLAVWGANSYGQLGTGIKSELISEPVFLDSSRLQNIPSLSEIKSICGGGGHTLILFKDGSLHGCGWNEAGQLMANEPIVLDLKRLPNLDEFNIVQIASKWDTSYAVTDAGLCIGWGSNAYCQLGRPREEFLSSRKPVILAKDAKQVSCGGRHCVILKKDGTVVTVGDNKFGKLGRKAGNLEATFGEVENLREVGIVACGFNHSIALTRDGKVYGWGCNKWGQLGVEPGRFRWAEDPVQVLTLSAVTVSSLHCGWSSTHLLMKEGGVVNFGRNNYGQLGQAGLSNTKDWDPHVLKNIQAISVGSEHALGLTDEGRLVSWGWNEHGSCGAGEGPDQPTPISVLLPTPSSSLIALFAAVSAHNFALVQPPLTPSNK